MRSNKEDVVQEDSDHSDLEESDLEDGDHCDLADSDDFYLEDGDDSDLTVDNYLRRTKLYNCGFGVDFFLMKDGDVSHRDVSHLLEDDLLRRTKLYNLGFGEDDFSVMFQFKVRECPYSHVAQSRWLKCPCAHPGEKARRRDPRKHHYSTSACPDYQNDACSSGDACEYAHGEFESWLHPDRYRTQLHEDGTDCSRRVCFFAHTLEELRIQPYTRRQTMFKLFEQMIEWRWWKKTTKRDSVEFNWTHFELSILHKYVLNLGLDSDFRVLKFAKLFKNEFWYRMPESSTRDASIVAFFAEELQEFFVVPKQHQLFRRDDDNLELVAAFINLLLRLLYCREVLPVSLNDKIKHLEKRLRLLLTAIGDKSLICDEEHEQVRDLLVEIEAVANEAGSLVHSIVFSSFADRTIKTMDKRLDVLLKHVDLLAANIIKFSKLHPANITAVSSPFIFDIDHSYLDRCLRMFTFHDFPVDDYFLMFEFKVRECQDTSHDWSYEYQKCPYAHSSGDDRRRDPIKYHYSSSPCPDYGKGACWMGDKCDFAHGQFECFLHPARYRTQLCEDGTHRDRPRHVCFFAHTPEQLRVQPYTRRQTILKLFEQMIEWRRMKKTRKRDSVKFNWTHFQLSILHSYIFKLRLDSNFRVLSFAKLFKDEFWYRIPGSSTRDARIVAFFAEELQEFFVVPKQHQLFQRDDDNLKQRELMEVLINLLLRLMHHRKGSINSHEDRIKNVEKELRFLLTAVGDKSLICDEEHEQVRDLLAEIEAVANKAGSLAHSVVFATFADGIIKTMDKRLDVLLKHMGILKANIIKFSKLQRVNITPKMDAVSSLFIVDSLLYDLENLLNRKDDMISDVKHQIKELQQELKLSKYYSKMSRYSEMEESKEHVMRIRGAACEAEYLINSFLVGDAPHWYFSIRLSHVIHKIKLIQTGIQETKKKHSIIASKVEKDFSAELSLPNKRSCEVDDIVVGFEDNERYILGHLEGGKEHLQIIAISGMPGLGKTTLAKKLYNHPLVKYHFDKCFWCVVSQTYYRKNLLIDILDSLKSELDQVDISMMEEESLVTRIYQSLKGRRYLVVIDDVWSSNTWYDFQRCFPDDQNKSRILLTSRNKDVAPPNSLIYELPCMSDEQCWELLKKKVFQDEPCPPQLLKTGKNIAAKCRGVPLAVVVVAGILSSMDKESYTWKDVEGNLESYIFSDQSNSMMQILELSYKYLPDHLKPCFLYFGALPEDTQIPIRKLMRLWIAEGFIIREHKKSSESLAEEYLMELTKKSLVMVAKRRFDGGVKAIVVHDLLHELCLERSKEENFLKLVDKNKPIYEKHHRLRVLRSEAASPISLLFGLHVRSFFGSLQNSSVLNMKLLRVLDLLEIGNNDNLNEIKLLVNLRYLAVNYTSFGTNIAWIGSLVNLEFLLMLRFEIYITPEIVKMMKLRYAKFAGVKFGTHCNSSQTNNLESLSCVQISSLKDEKMLKCSPRLRKLKCKCNVLWDKETGEYRYPDFSFFTQLESLWMGLSFIEPEKADIISLPLSVKKLTLTELRLPWEKMSIIGGLPNLQVLKLLRNAFAGEVWETRDGEFQQLTVLKLDGSDPVQWNVPASDHFPKLRQLVLKNCGLLREIPSEIGEIATLQLIKVKGSCLWSLKDSAQKIEREQQDNENEELNVIFTKATTSG